MESLGFLLQNRGWRTTGGSGGENRSTGQILFANGLVSLQRQNEIRRLGGIVSRTEDFVLIALECSNPGVDVSGVLLGIVRDAALRGEEHARQLRTKLLFRIVHVAKTIRFVSVERSSREG